MWRLQHDLHRGFTPEALGWFIYRYPLLKFGVGTRFLVVEGMQKKSPGSKPEPKLTDQQAL